jgi:hypothetical protein
MISYTVVLSGVQGALSLAEVDGSAERLANEMLLALLEGRQPESSTQIRYLDAMFAICDALQEHNVGTADYDREEFAEAILRLAEKDASQSALGVTLREWLSEHTTSTASGETPRRFSGRPRLVCVDGRRGTCGH